MRSVIAFVAILFLSVPAAAQSRGWIDVNLGTAAAAEKSVTQEANIIDFAGEIETYRVGYSFPTGAEFDFGGGFMFSRVLGFGVQFTGTAHQDQADLFIRIPHPRFFDAHASDTGFTDDKLQRTEGGVNLSLVASVPSANSTLQLRVYGGPTYFRLEADAIDDIQYAQQFGLFTRANSVEITTWSSEKVEQTGWGFHAGADVPDLRVINKGALPVLIIDGEELVGAKQNRVVNLTILVPAASELTIPVSCVEAGRWRFRSKQFASAPRTQYATGRARKMAQVTASMWSRAESRGDISAYRSDQAEVWQHIAEKSARLGASSPTSAMEALFTTHADSIEHFVAACRPADSQVGALFAVNGRIVGFDLFDRPATLQKVLPKLVRAVAIEALDSVGPQLPAMQQDLARLFLGAVAAAPAHATPALGLGDDVRASAPGLTGAALLVEDGVVHLSGFAV